MSQPVRRAELHPGFEIDTDDVVVDVGCGAGDACVIAGNLGADVIAIDVNPKYVEHVAERMKGTTARSFRGVVATDTTIPLDDSSADALVVREVMEHVPDPPHFLSELFRVAKPGGRVLLSVPDAASESLMKLVVEPSYFQPPGHINIFQRDRLDVLVQEAGFQVISTSYVGFYSAVWWILRTATESTCTPWQESFPEPLASWDRVHKALEQSKAGPAIVAAFDRLLPKSQVLILEKPARGASTTLEVPSEKAPVESNTDVVSRRAYETLLALHRETQQHLDTLRQKMASEPSAAPTLTQGLEPTMTPAFYDQGCVASSRWKWPVVAVRRLLRRLQRPFFFALQAELESLRARDAELRAAVAQLQADRDSLLQLLRSDNTQSQPIPIVEAIANAGLPPLAILNKLESLDRMLCEVVASPAGAPRKLPPSPQPYRVLFALSSSTQMFSGVGRTIFETVKQLRGRVEYEFAMDDGEERNVRLLANFCKGQGLTLHLGRSVIPTRTMDRSNADLPNLLREQRWDAFEVASWGSSATNQAVLDHARDTPIIYTPYYQPISSVPGAENCTTAIERAHFGLLRQSSLVVCCSAWEWLTLQADAGSSPAHFALVTLGIDRDAFAPGRSERRPYLLFVGDFRERRKRLPLTLEVFAEVLKAHPQMQLVIVGNESERTIEQVPEPLRRKVVLMGYVSEERLHELYRESMGLMLLSDYEAFGMPILEALASGTPAFISRRSTVSTLFAGYKGAIFVDDDRPDRMAKVIAAALDRWPQLVQETLADAARIARDCSWDTLSLQRFDAMRRALAKPVAVDREIRIRPALAH